MSHFRQQREVSAAPRVANRFDHPLLLGRLDLEILAAVKRPDGHILEVAGPRHITEPGHRHDGRPARRRDGGDVPRAEAAHRRTGQNFVLAIDAELFFDLVENRRPA